MKLSTVFLAAFSSLFFLHTSSALADDFFTRAEIEKSSLNDAEKGMAMGALLTAPMIKCTSSDEGVSGNFERLRIYHVVIGNVLEANVAVWNAYGKLTVFGNFEPSKSITNAFKTSQSVMLGTVDAEFSDHSLAVHFGPIIPMLGKAAEVEFIKLGKIKNQICTLAK